MKKRYYTIIPGLLLAAMLIGCEEEVTVTDSAIYVENNFSSQTPSDIEIVVAQDDTTENMDEDIADEDISEEEIAENEASEVTDEQAETEQSEEPDEDAESSEEENDEQTESSEEKEEESDENSEETGEVDKAQEITPVTPGSIENISLNEGWTYANYSAIHTGQAVMYRAAENRKGIVIGVNAGHGTKGVGGVKTYCHPDMTPKVTGGSTAAGSIQAVAISGGMSFYDGTAEAAVTLREAQIVRDKLLAAGYDVLMLRDGSDVQLDNIARTVICNNMANCHISIHWDGDGLSSDKGCFYISTPDGIKGMEPVASTWTKSEALGKSLIAGLTSQGCKIYKGGAMAIDLTQTSYSTVPSVDVELGNAASAHDDASLSVLADGIVAGVKAYFP